MKYKLTSEIKQVYGRTLHRIVCMTAFADVIAGELGGWIESEKNLSQNGDAWVYGNVCVCGNAKVHDQADYIVLKNTWSSGRYFTFTASNRMWKVGCFHGSGEQLIVKAYEDSKVSGDCYKATVEYVENLYKIIDNQKER